MSNVIPLFPGIAIPGQGSSKEEQEAITREVMDVLAPNRGSLATLGGIVRRFDFENLIGHEITEEAFEFITDTVSAYALRVLVPVLPLIVANAYANYNTEESE